jgi:transcriptional regulator with XRE-family HTH domain
MSFTQLHERLRQELLRRIQRGTLSVSLLARQSGFGQSHMSNFLRSRRQLSLEALDRILIVQNLTVPDLLPALRQTASPDGAEETGEIPIVSHTAAIFEPFIRQSAGQEMLRVPARNLQSIRPRAPNTRRRAWQRFVAVRVQAADAIPMDPLLLPDAVALIDRHYNSLSPYRPNRPNLYAVCQGAHLTLRYVEFLANRLVLRPHNLAFPVDMIPVDPGEPPNEMLAGRVVLIVNEP